MGSLLYYHAGYASALNATPRLKWNGRTQGVPIKYECSDRQWYSGTVVSPLMFDREEICIELSPFRRQCEEEIIRNVRRQSAIS